MANMPLLYDALQSDGGIKFIELNAPSVRLPQPPRFFFGTISEELSRNYFALTHLHQEGVFVCSDTEVVAPYLIVHRQTVLACPQANLHQAHLELFMTKGEAAAKPSLKRTVAGDCAMIFGPGYKIFGHWMIDFLPKIYLIEKAGYDLARTSFLLPSDCPSFGPQLLELIGIKRDQIVLFDPRTEKAVCEHLLVPTTCHNGLLPSYLLTASIAWIRKQIEANVGPLGTQNATKRLFVSRARGYASNRALLNRAEIEAMAVDHGFKLICPEEISLFEQFKIFAQSREIIGEYGSALHNAMFSSAGTTICALRGNSVHPGFVQSGIAEALGHHMGYVIGKNVTDAWDFVIDPEHFAAMLRCVFSGASLEKMRARERDPVAAALGRDTIPMLSTSMVLSLR